MRRLAREQVRGFRVYPRDAPIAAWMQTAAFDRMFECAGDLGLAICPLIDPPALPSLSRMCEKHPNTRVVIDHLCRIGLDGEVRTRDVDALRAMAQYPRTYVKVSAFYALGNKRPPHEDLEPVVRRVHEAFGARRLMWASDCPFQVVNEAYADSIGLVRDRLPWLSGEDRDWLLRRTAEEVFFT